MKTNPYDVLTGKTIKSVVEGNGADESIELTFTDGSKATLSGGSWSGEGVLGINYEEAQTSVDLE